MTLDETSNISVFYDGALGFISEKQDKYECFLYNVCLFSVLALVFNFKLPISFAVPCLDWP